MVVSKHIDWATGYGINHFYTNFNPSGSIGDERLNPFVTNSLVGDIKFLILYETELRFGGAAETRGLPELDLNDPTLLSILESDFARIAKNYFSHPSYLTVKGHPAVYIYGTGVIETDIATPLAKLRDYLKGLGFEPYLIGDEIEPLWLHPIDSKRLQAFDAVTGYGLPPAGADDRSAEATRTEYARWQSYAHAVGVEIIPAVYPGYDDRHLVEIGNRPKSYGYVPRSTQFLASNLQVARDFIDKSGLLGVVSWDEWGEKSYIEPTVEDGFKYLQTLRDTLGLS
jgi:hypothetical protein